MFGIGLIVIVCELEMRANGFVPVCQAFIFPLLLFTSPLTSKLAINTDITELFFYV